MRKLGLQQIWDHKLKRNMPTHYTKTLLLRSQTKHHSKNGLKQGLNYDRSNKDLSAGYGIAQWTSYDRKKGLLDFARKYKYRPDALGLQLGYLNYELRTHVKMLETISKMKIIIMLMI